MRLLMRSRKRTATLWLLLLSAAVIGLRPARAAAFTEPRTYFEDEKSGGGGGRWFTGSPAEGYGCNVCHTGPGPSELRVEGLPKQGYTPGKRYALRLSWPEFADRASKLRKTAKRPPALGLVAELVAESGLGAGSLEIAAPNDANAHELCLVPEGQQAAQLYSVHPGEGATEQGLRCDASTLGQRCLVAEVSCGAEELRVVWTAPARAQGPIWFSAGFVTTDQISGDPSGDRVTQIAEPILPAASHAKQVETTLHSTCTVMDPRPRRGGAAALALAVLAVVVSVIRARARRSEARR